MHMCVLTVCGSGCEREGVCDTFARRFLFVSVCRAFILRARLCLVSTKICLHVGVFL